MPQTTAQGQPSDNQRTEYGGFSLANRIGYRFMDLDPSTNVYVQRDDLLVIEFVTGVAAETLQIGIRQLLPGRVQGPAQPDASSPASPLGNSPYGQVVTTIQTIRSTAINLLQTASFVLAEGYLLSLAISSTIAQTRGQTFVRAFIVRGPVAVTNSAYMLLGDYVNTNAPVGFPFGRSISPLEGPGNVRFTQPANPAAGADFTIAPPVGTKWRVLSLQATFTASGVAATRNIRAQIFDNNTARATGTFVANVGVTAGQVAAVTVAPGAVANATVPLNLTIAFPPDVILSTSTVAQVFLRTSTQNIDAGDQWSAISLLLEEWMDI